MSSKEDALSTNIPDPTNVLLGRLDNWNHTVSLLTDFIESHITIQKTITSGLEKSKKLVADAPKFDYASPTPTSSVPTSPIVGQETAATVSLDANTTTTLGENGETSQPTGIAEAFNEIRSQTELLINKSNSVEQQLRSAILPQLEILKGDIEKHHKGFKGPGLKGQKDVQNAKLTTQKYVESLGQHVAAFGAPVGSSAGSKSDAKHDPFIERRLALNSLQDQITKENSQTDAIISVQNNFQTLERHIVQVLQQAVTVFDEILKGYGASEIDGFSSISAKFNNIQADHEWNQFVSRRGDILIPPNAPKRNIDNITFTNIDHQATVPIIEGTLQIKTGKLLKSYNPAYFVVTPSKYLHQFKSQDYVQDPTPELSLYLPGTSLGQPASRDSGKFKFEIEGKASKTISTKHKFTLKTNTYDEMIAWHTAIAKASGNVSSVDNGSEPSTPTSPTVGSVPPAATAAAVAAATAATTEPVAAAAATEQVAATTETEAAPAYSSEAATAELSSDVEHIHIG